MEYCALSVNRQSKHITIFVHTGSRVTATPGTMPRLLVDREKKWVQTTILKVCERLNLALPALVEHPSPTVRSALAHGKHVYGYWKMLVICQCVC